MSDRYAWGGYRYAQGDGSGSASPEPSPNACRVHPAKSGAERKTIGLFPCPGQTQDDAYAEWALRRGERCTCP